ncbi:MAG TPA: 3'-5' exonuclease [Anaerolineales bacterium]|nr:3'-5' exonuclease [Anaerolineales bacterium]
MTAFTYISVDIEAAGPNPHDYALLSIGACAVDNPEQAFYVELQPTTDRLLPQALAVHGLTLEALRTRGLPPGEAMQRFAEWIAETTPPGALPLLVAFNAPFDWMFVADYFHRFLGENPFGHSALDIKAYALGLHGGGWEDTSMARILARYPTGVGALTHNALQDARDQAALFRQMLTAAKRLAAP